MVEELQVEIGEQNKRKVELKEKTEVVNKSISSIVDILVLILLQIDPKANKDVDHSEIIQTIQNKLQYAIDKFEGEEEVLEEEIEKVNKLIKNLVITSIASL